MYQRRFSLDSDGEEPRVQTCGACVLPHERRQVPARPMPRGDRDDGRSIAPSGLARPRRHSPTRVLRRRAARGGRTGAAAHRACAPTSRHRALRCRAGASPPTGRRPRTVRSVMTDPALDLAVSRRPAGGPRPRSRLRRWSPEPRPPCSPRSAASSSPWTTPSGWPWSCARRTWIACAKGSPSCAGPARGASISRRPVDALVRGRRAAAGGGGGGRGGGLGGGPARRSPLSRSPTTRPAACAARSRVRESARCGFWVCRARPPSLLPARLYPCEHGSSERTSTTTRCRLPGTALGGTDFLAVRPAPVREDPACSACADGGDLQRDLPLQQLRADRPRGTGPTGCSARLEQACVREVGRVLRGVPCNGPRWRRWRTVMDEKRVGDPLAKRGQWTRPPSTMSGAPSEPVLGCPDVGLQGRW